MLQKQLSPLADQLLKCALVPKNINFRFSAGVHPVDKVHINSIVVNKDIMYNNLLDEHLKEKHLINKKARLHM